MARKPWSYNFGRMWVGYWFTSPFCCHHFLPPRDSMARDLLKALRCFLVEFYDGRQYAPSSNSSIMHHLDALPNGGEPRCIHMPGDTRICQVKEEEEGDTEAITRTTAASNLFMCCLHCRQQHLLCTAQCELPSASL